MKMRRHTRQRQVILEELRKAPNHPTAAELFGLVKVQVPRISLGTVYRNLEQLCEDGTIRKVPGTGNETRYDGDLTEHWHLRCRECGHIHDVHGPVSVETAGKTGLRLGWVALEQRLELIGLCPDCQTSGVAAKSEIKQEPYS
jgi:Fur family ferric uptake transcriptional regulator